VGGRSPDSLDSNWGEAWGAVTPETISGASPHHGLLWFGGFGCFETLGLHGGAQSAPVDAPEFLLAHCFSEERTAQDPGRSASTRTRRDGRVVAVSTGMSVPSANPEKGRKRPFFQRASHLASSDPFQLREKYDDAAAAAAAVSCCLLDSPSALDKHRTAHCSCFISASTSRQDCPTSSVPFHTLHPPPLPTVRCPPSTPHGS